MSWRSKQAIDSNLKENVYFSLLDIALLEKVAVDCLISIQCRQRPRNSRWRGFSVTLSPQSSVFWAYHRSIQPKETNKHTDTAKKLAYIAMRLRRMRQRVDELLIVGFRKEKHISLLCCTIYTLYCNTIISWSCGRAVKAKVVFLFYDLCVMFASWCACGGVYDIIY